jgi:hypothetical protein
MPILKKYLGLILGLAAIAMIYIIWQETGKITGEVSAAGSTGAAVALSGARVTLYEVTEGQQQRISAALDKLQQQNQLEKADNARVYSAESKDEMVRSNLASFNNLSDTKHCFALEKALDEVRKSAVRKEAADSQGHFGFRALPGHYVLEIVSQANGQYSVFAEPVEPKWHTHFKLAEPTCHYSLSN